MKTASRILRTFLLVFMLGVVCMSMSCGGAKTADLSPAPTDAKIEDNSSKAISAINGDFSFVSPTPADDSSFTGEFTFDVAVSCTGVSGGTSYYMRYVLYKADDSVSYYTYKTNKFSFAHTIPLPDDYFNWVTLEAIFYGYNSVDGLVVLDVETRDYFVNTMYY